MRNIKISVATMIILSGVLSACELGKQENAQEKLVATIDQQTIRLSDFKRELQWLSIGDDSSDIEYREKKIIRIFLKRFIDKKLLLREVEYNHVVIASNAVEAAYKRSLNKWSENDIHLELKKRDMTTSEYKQNIRERLLIQKYFQTLIYPRVVVRDDEISAYLEKNAEILHKPESVHVRQIVTKTEKEAAHAIQEIERGLAFEDAALKYSLSPDAKNGGDLGYIERGTMPRFFDKAVFNLEQNRLSTIIPSDYGFFVFEVMDKKDALPLSEASARHNAETILRQQKEQETQEKLIEDLRKQSEINIMESNIALLF